MIIIIIIIICNKILICKTKFNSEISNENVKEKSFKCILFLFQMGIYLQNKPKIRLQLLQ